MIVRDNRESSLGILINDREPRRDADENLGSASGTDSADIIELANHPFFASDEDLAATLPQIRPLGYASCPQKVQGADLRTRIPEMIPFSRRV